MLLSEPSLFSESHVCARRRLRLAFRDDESFKAVGRWEFLAGVRVVDVLSDATVLEVALVQACVFCRGVLND